MTIAGAFDKEQLFDAFIVAIKRPDVFTEERELAEQWLANTDNNQYLRPYSGRIHTVLYHEVLPQVVRDILMEFHDDYVESLNAEQLAAYRERLSPRNMLAVLA